MSNLPDPIIPNRDHQHGGMEPVGRVSQQIKGAMRYGGDNWHRLTPGEREALDMIAHKIARILSGGDPHDLEHWTDLAGYAHAAMRGAHGGSTTTTTETHGDTMNPADCIDPEHTGADRHLLEVFYRACHAEGGTADEIHLRGLRAVLTDAALAQPAAPVSGSKMSACNHRAAARFAILDRLEKAIDFNSHGWRLTPEGERWTQLMAEQGQDEFEMGL